MQCRNHGGRINVVFRNAIFSTTFLLLSFKDLLVLICDQITVLKAKFLSPMKLLVLCNSALAKHAVCPYVIICD